MLRFVCLAILVALSSAKLTYRECGHGEVRDIEVSGCESAPCTLHKGKEVTITVVFEANEDSETLKIDLSAHVVILDVHVPLHDTNGCDFTTCPIKKGDVKTLKYKVTIPESAPTISADLTAKLIGDHNKIMACGVVHGSIHA